MSMVYVHAFKKPTFQRSQKNKIDLHRFVIFENITQLISWLVLVADKAGALIG